MVIVNIIIIVVVVVIIFIAMIIVIITTTITIVVTITITVIVTTIVTVIVITTATVTITTIVMVMMPLFIVNVLKKVDFVEQFSSCHPHISLGLVQWSAELPTPAPVRLYLQLWSPQSGASGRSWGVHTGISTAGRAPAGTAHMTWYQASLVWACAVKPLPRPRRPHYPDIPPRPTALGDKGPWWTPGQDTAEQWSNLMVRIKMYLTPIRTHWLKFRERYLLVMSSETGKESTKKISGRNAFLF